MKFDPSSAVPEQEFDPTTAVPEEAPPVRAVLHNAVKVNPDQAARAATLGKERGLPADVVLRNLADVELQAAVDAADERLKTSPKLAAAMRKRPDIAPMAHDDLGPLSEVEAAVRKHGELKAWNGPAPTLKNIALGLAKAVPQAGGAIKAGLDAEMTDFLEWVGLVTLDPIVKADRARKLAQASGAADFTRPEFETSTARAVYGGLESTLRMIPGLAASIATRSPTPMLATAGVQSQGEAYAKYRSRGADGGQAFLGATGEGLVEVATELLPAGFLTSRLGKAGVGEFVTGLLAREIPGEQIATLLQDAIDTAVANPDKTWGEYLNERPQAAYETLISTLTQSALMGGVHTAARRLAQMGDQGQQANDAATALGEALKTAGAAALRERSPEQFRALMGEMTDGKVYVDGEVLNQLPDDVKASLPQAVQDQIATAAATGDVVEIATADVLTIAPGTALEGVLVEHARTDPFSMSKADAAEASKLAQSSVLNDAQRLIEQAQDVEARQAEYDAIHKLYVDQLNETARFRPAVNDAKAHWLASFYTTMAARTGMTPAQFQAAHPVRILDAPSTTTGPVMDQSKSGEITVEGYHFSKEDRPVLTTAAYGTGLQGSGRDTYLNAEDQRLRKRTYFYADKGTGIRPESGVGGRAHRVNLTNVYDSNRDPLGLKKGPGGQLGFESRVLDAGFSGYLDRLEGTQPGQVIMLGGQTFQPELLGAQSQIVTGQRVPGLPQAAPQWQTQASGEPAMLQAKLEAMQAKSAWADYDLRIEGRELQARKKEAVFAQVTPQQAQETNVPVEMPTDPLFAEAVANTSGAQITDEGLVMDLVRFQKPEQEGAQAIRTGVFYLPAKSADVRHYRNAKTGYGGAERFAGGTLIRRPLFVKGATGGAAPEQAYKTLKGKDALAEMSRAVTQVIARGDNYMWPAPTLKLQLIKEFLDQYAPESTGLAREIERVSREGNTLRYALQELAVAHAVRAAGHDAVVGYSAKKTGPAISEVFDVREQTFPARGGDSQIHDAYYEQQAGDLNGQAGNRAGRYSSGGLAPLAGAPAVAGATGPDARLVAVAEQYAAERGIDLRRQPAYVTVDPERAARIAAAYEAMPHAPQDPAVREAYDNLVQQTLDQYLALQAAGYQFYLVDETNDPYAGNPWNAMRDLRANQTMGVFATEAGFGSSDLDVSGNPLLADTGIEWGYGSPGGPKKRVLANDLFRAVHDAFGHGLEGAGFRAQGEENAWQAHRALFTGSAVGAITTETRGQNSWLNYGPHGEKNQTAKVEDTVFADQKTGLMPEWTWTEGVVGEQLEQLEQADSEAQREAQIDAVYSEIANDQEMIDALEVYMVSGDAPEGALNDRLLAYINRLSPVPADSYLTFYRNQPRGARPWERGWSSWTINEDQTRYFGGRDFEVLKRKGVQGLDLNRLGEYRTRVTGDYSQYGSQGEWLVLNESVFNQQPQQPRGTFNPVTRIPKNKITATLAPDDVGTKDANARAYSSTQVLFQPGTPAFDAWFGDSKVVGAQGPLTPAGGALVRWFAAAGENTMVGPDGTPRVLYHGTTKAGARGVEAGQFKRSTYGAMGPAVYLGDDAEASAGYEDGAMLQVYARGKYLTNQQWTEYVNTHGWTGAETAATADGWAGVYDEQFENAVAVWNPANIKSVGAKEFKDDGQFLSQAAAQTPRGTFNPATLELVLNPNANLSTFFHETGHFFLEVLADVASQPNAPAQIVEDMATFLKWAGIPDLQTWNSLDLDGKRAAHERWAESIEQYVMEGRAPSIELQPLMRRFATWLKSVYGSIQRFLAARGQATSGPVLGQADDSAFDKWFGKSKVVDGKGKPLVVYHGTLADFSTFELGKGEAQSHGFFFTNKENVNTYIWSYLDSQKYQRVERPGNHTVMPSYLSIQNPMLVENQEDDGNWADPEFENEQIKLAKKRGHDGLIVTDNYMGTVFYVAFRPEQIKSAIGNDGSFDANDPSVLSQDPAAQPGPPMALNDDIRRVMDRLLATDEQIAQANEVAGLAPDEAADAAASERLAKRSIADLKWSVRARDQVITRLQKQAKAIEKDLREQVTVEVDQMPEMRAKRALDALTVSPEYAGVLAEHKAARKAAEAAVRDDVKAALLATNPDAKGLVKGQLLMKNKRDIDNKVDAAMIKWDQANPVPARPVNATDEDVATIADSFGFESVDAMMQSIDAFGARREVIDGLTEQRMLEEHGDLIDERAISEAANEAVHNEARARSLASELRTQREMLNPRQETGATTAKGAKVTVNALVEAAKQFAANVVGRTTLRDLKARAWQHTAAERRAAARWQQATAGGKTEEAVKAKQDQMLNHAAAKAAIDAKTEAKKILEFFKRVTKGNDETVVEKGRDPDIVNAARAALAAYGVQGPATKNAADYLETLSRNDPETYNVILPMVEGATRNAQPLDALTFEELQALEEEIQAMWFLAKRSRQMEVDGDLLDVQDVAEEVYARLEEIGIPDTLPGETGALTEREIQARRWLQQVPALLRRVEQWAEAKDGKFGGPFSRFIFGPVKTAADAYRTARLDYRKRFQVLVDNIAPMMPAKTIAAPELGYVFGRGHNGIGMAELLHAIAHTGNESNKRKLLLGRGWATDNGDGTIDTGKWDAFIGRLAADGTLQREHFDFVQGVWDLMEQTKPLAQATHRAVFGRYFAEVTADAFVDPFGVARSGGYIPAQADPLLVQDADLRELLETDNAGMSQAFPATNRGFTKGRVEYNRPLKLDLRTLPQHIDKVLLFSHMEPAVRGVARLLRQPKVAQPLARVDPAAIGGMLKPWLNRSARQTVETPVSADAGLNRVLSTTRARVGMALMFANVSNTLQQITGFFSAATKVKPGLMRRATAQFIAHPKRFRDAVWALSPYMADRASNEVSVLSDTMEKILINPGVFQRAEAWTRQHAYFMQTAFDNVMSPIIWTGAYNQGITEGMDERMAIRFADGVIRQTQGSTLPEDVSRIETGPAYARVFTQFIGYFNMLANTNATALQQIAAEQGLKKGAGKAFGVVVLGLLAPIWVAEAIAHAMRGGPEDEDDDGYLDDWLVAVFGFGTIRGILAGVPFVGAAAQSAVNRFNSQPADDKFSLSPTVSVLESAVGAPASVYGAIVDDKNAQKAVRDVSALITVATGLPGMAVARPLGYLAGVAQGRIEPTGPADAARGLVTGTASPASKQQ